MRNQRNRRYRRQRTRRLSMIQIIALCGFVAVLLLIAVFSGTETASGKTNKYKTVASVYIQTGDSLWSIASEYYSEECGTMREYIQEICDANHLDDDTIHAGGYLIVPYYKDADLSTEMSYAYVAADARP